MSQITSGVRAVLSSPIIYTMFQFLMGAKAGKQFFIKGYMKPKPGDKILDIGCGPADILNYLPENIEYWGFDISREYIQKAQLKFGERGNFKEKLLEFSDLDNLPKFDHVILTGVFHHLDDDMAKHVVNLSFSALREGGKLISKDPCYTPKQNPVAKFLVSKDRGQNVRIEEGYRNLVNHKFHNIVTEVVHKAWIPYTHCYMVCKK